MAAEVEERAARPQQVVRAETEEPDSEELEAVAVVDLLQAMVVQVGMVGTVQS